MKRPAISPVRVGVPHAYDAMVAEHGARTGERVVDANVHRLPDLARLRRRVVAEERRLLTARSDKRAFIRYADMRSALEGRRMEAYFDQGHERGRLMALAAGQAEGGRHQLRRLVDEVVEAVMGSGLPPGLVATVLLDAARAVVAGWRTGGR